MKNNVLRKVLITMLVIITFTCIFALPYGNEICMASDLEPGNIEGVYQISSVSDLMWIVNEINENRLSDVKLKLIDDIDMQSITDFKMVGSDNVPLTINIDGNSKSIKNLNLNDTDEASSGLAIFNTIKDSIIKDLTFDGIKVSGCNNVSVIAKKSVNTEFNNIKFNNVNLTGQSYVGLCSANSDTCTFDGVTLLDNVFVSGEIVGSSKKVEYIGGITGYSKNTDYKNIILGSSTTLSNESVVIILNDAGFLGNTTANYIYVGGLTGYMENGHIKNVESYACIYSSGYYTGGLCGFAKANYTNEDKEALTVEGINIKGIVFSSSYYTGGYFGSVEATNVVGSKLLLDEEITLDFHLSGYSSVGGLMGYAKNVNFINTSDKPFTLKYGENFKLLANEYYFGGLVGKYEGTNTNEISYINIIGRGTSSNILNDEVSYSSAFIADIIGAHIHHITAENIYIKESRAGGILFECVTGSYEDSSIAKVNDITIKNCIVEAGDLSAAVTAVFSYNVCFENIEVKNTKVTGEEEVGGIAAFSTGYFKNCHVASDCVITGTKEVGGIVGDIVIETNKTTNKRNYTEEATFMNCVNDATVISSGSAGGILGYYYKSGRGYTLTLMFENCVNTGKITSTGGIAGGMIGISAYYTIEKLVNCANYGKLDAKTYAGGMIGYISLPEYVELKTRKICPVNFYSCVSYAKDQAKSNTNAFIGKVAVDKNFGIEINSENCYANDKAGYNIIFKSGDAEDIKYIYYNLNKAPTRDTFPGYDILNIIDDSFFKDGRLGYVLNLDIEEFKIDEGHQYFNTSDYSIWRQIIDYSGKTKMVYPMPVGTYTYFTDKNESIIYPMNFEVGERQYDYFSNYNNEESAKTSKAGDTSYLVTVNKVLDGKEFFPMIKERVASGTSKTLKAIAIDGYDFIGFYDVSDDSCVESSPKYTLSEISSDITLTAKYERYDSYSPVIISKSDDVTYDINNVPQTKPTFEVKLDSSYIHDTTYNVYYDGENIVSSESLQDDTIFYVVGSTAGKDGGIFTSIGTHTYKFEIINDGKYRNYANINVTITNPEAEVDGIKYERLSSLFANNDLNGKTVKLLKDISSNITISNTNCAIDFNNKSITGGLILFNSNVKFENVKENSSFSIRYNYNYDYTEHKYIILPSCVDFNHQNITSLKVDVYNVGDSIIEYGWKMAKNAENVGTITVSNMGYALNKIDSDDNGTLDGFDLYKTKTRPFGVIVDKSGKIMSFYETMGEAVSAMKKYSDESDNTIYVLKYINYNTYSFTVFTYECDYNFTGENIKLKEVFRLTNGNSSCFYIHDDQGEYELYTQNGGETFPVNKSQNTLYLSKKETTLQGNLVWDDGLTLDHVKLVKIVPPQPTRRKKKTTEVKTEEEKMQEELQEKIEEEFINDEVKLASSNEKENINPDTKFINGYDDGTFRPNDNVSNIELMSMVTSLYSNIDTLNSNINLNEGDNYWGEEIIKKANTLNLIPGNKNSKSYDVNAKVTRGDLAIVIYNLIKDYTPSINLKESNTCKDAIGTEYELAVAKLVELGILKGYDDGLFHGENNLTRAEAVTVINRALKSLGFEIKMPSIKLTFPDLDETHWAYYEILYASNK